MNAAAADRSLGIDFLRALSILLVVWSHYVPDNLLLLSGVHGVALFFMVSGYCMAYSTKGRTGKEFLSARFWRLVPALVACATITVLFEWFFPELLQGRTQSFKSYILNLVCLPNGNVLCDAPMLAIRQIPISYTWVDGAYWSLLVEIRFYLVLWFLVYILKIRTPAFHLALLGCLAILNEPFSFLSKGQDFLIYLNFFAFGLAYRDFADGNKKAAAFLVLSLLVLIGQCFFGSTAISMTLNMELFLSYWLCFLIFVVALNVFQGMKSAAITYLGILSYPLYLIHQDVGLGLIAGLRDAFGVWGARLFALIAAIALAMLVHHGVEKNTRHIKAFLFRRKLS